MTKCEVEKEAKVLLKDASIYIKDNDVKACRTCVQEIEEMLEYMIESKLKYQQELIGQLEEALEKLLNKIEPDYSFDNLD